MNYKHHIQLRTPEPISGEDAVMWYETVKEFGPSGTVYAYKHDGKEVGMEYGTLEDDEMPHGYVVPLIRDIDSDEALFIVAAWEYLYKGDFNIELSNQFDTADPEDIEDIELDIEESLRQQVITDMNKWEHNRWVDQMVSEGWRCGSYYNSKQKTHPAMKNWDSLPESHRRSRQISNREVFEWIQRYNFN